MLRTEKSKSTTKLVTMSADAVIAKYIALIYSYGSEETFNTTAMEFAENKEFIHSSQYWSKICRNNDNKFISGEGQEKFKQILQIMSNQDNLNEISERSIVVDQALRNLRRTSELSENTREKFDTLLESTFEFRNLFISIARQLKIKEPKNIHDEVKFLKEKNKRLEEKISLLESQAEENKVHGLSSRRIKK